MRYVVFNKSDGAILRVGECAPWDVQLQKQSADEAVVVMPEASLARIDDSLHYVDTANADQMKIRRKLDDGLIALPVEPAYSKLPNGQRRLPG